MGVVPFLDRGIYFRKCIWSKFSGLFRFFFRETGVLRGTAHARTIIWTKGTPGTAGEWRVSREKHKTAEGTL